MSNTDFDRFLHDKLAGHASPVPPDMWNKIKPAGKKRRGYYWWKNIGLTLVIIAMVSAGYLLYQPARNQHVSKQLSSTSLPASARQKQADFGQRATSNLSTKKQKSNDVRQPQRTTESLVDTLPGSNASTISTHTKRRQATSINSRKFFNKADHKPLATFYKNARQFVHPNNLSGNTPLPNSAADALKPSGFQLLYGELTAQDKSFTTQKLALLSEEQKKYNLSCFVRCPPQGLYRNRPVFLELYLSPDYAGKRVTGRDSMNTEFVRRKDSTESFRSAFTAGFRFSKKLGSNTLVKTGLQYSMINEKFSYRSENERRTTTVITIRTVIRSPGDTILVRDTSTVEQIGYRIIKHLNKYQSIDIPLVVSYEWGNENLRMAVSGGVIFNLRSWQQGQMLDIDMVAKPFNKSPGMIFRKNLGLGLVAGVSVYKKLLPNVEAFAEPYFRYNLSDMTNGQFPLRQKFNVAGMNLGVRYKLSSRNF